MLYKNQLLIQDLFYEVLFLSLMGWIREILKLCLNNLNESC